MNIINQQLGIILPEIVFLGATIITLLIGLFIRQKNISLVYTFAQLTLIISAIFVWQLFSVDESTILSGHYRHDGITSILQLVILIMGMFIFAYSREYIKTYTGAVLEYYVLALLSIFGMLVLVSAYSLLTLYLGLELLSLPLYALVALKRENVQAVEAGLKYFIMGSIASGMLLYGMTMIFGVTGHLEINTIMQILASAQYDSLLMTFGLVFICVGIIFKLGGVPFHMWVPDVYHGAPASVTLLISTIPKVATFALALRLFAQVFADFQLQWQQILIVVSLLSMGLGNLVAIAQTNIKRMLAYSSIAHMGYMLLGLIAGTEAGYASAMFYMIAYALMSLGAFGLITMLSSVGVEAQAIEDFKGLNQRNPWLALMMLLMMFSMAGIPPIVGFFAKVGVLEALIKVDLVWLAVVALLFAIIGAYYYIRVVKVMYFDSADDTTPLVIAGFDNKLAISLNGLGILLLGILPGTLFELCRHVILRMS